MTLTIGVILLGNMVTTGLLIQLAVERLSCAWLIGAITWFVVWTFVVTYIRFGNELFA